ncbi:MAG: restriction endonuclease [Thermoleophilia bacterium]|nr:restriction endonuclease [Thermoleophilia bacterium]
MAKKNEGLLDLLLDFLIKLPWWVSICIAVIGAMVFMLMAPQSLWLAIMFAFCFLIVAGGSALISARKRRLLDRQKSIESIRSLEWKQFEELLGEAFRRLGYSVKENSSAGPDGGIDLTIKQNGNVYLVQCKQWRVFKVGVKVVREMLGLVTAHGAQGTIIVTSGMFTQEAKAFAQGKPIDLIEGHQLVGMIESVRRESAITASDTSGQTRSLGVPTMQSIASARQCPRCGGELVVKKARRGPTAGSSFWGCSSFPQCRYSEGIES